MDGTRHQNRISRRLDLRFLFFSLLLCAPFVLGFGPPTLAESDDVQLPVGKTQLSLLAGAPPPPTTGKASLVMDVATGRIVFQRNAAARLPQASITKIMTAILALERADLHAKVTITQEDLVEGSAMGVHPGDVYTVEQLLWGLLIPSGNDAAMALARYLGSGSAGRFVDMMNEKARDLRLENTRFANPHGLDAPNHYSSALDVATMASYALKYPLFAKIVATGEYEVQTPRGVVKLQTSNQLLFMKSDVPGVNGVKTGYTEEAGECLVATVDRGGQKVLTVVLGAATNRVTATRTLIDYAYKSFSWVPLYAPLSLRASPAGLLTTAASARVMVPSWQASLISYAVDVGKVPQDTAVPNPVGVVTYYVDRQELTQVPLYAQQR